jgi:nicotinate phosphoribosyltransferase
MLTLLDTDFYKLTMLQSIFHSYPGAWVRYAFKWRNWDKMHLHTSMGNFISMLDDKIDQFCSLSFAQKEIQYLESNPYLKKDFIEFLKLYKPNRDYIRVHQKDGELHIDIEGPWVIVEPYEVPILSRVTGLYMENCGQYKMNLIQEGRKRLSSKLGYLTTVIRKDQPFRFSDFSTRRRSFFDFQDEMIATCLERVPQFFVGTSNVYFAMKYGIKPIGTMAHEYVQAHQNLGYKLNDSQTAAFDTWSKEYRGDLGIALSDTLGFDAFLIDFDKYFAKLFDGCRHDSGDSIDWGEKLIRHYESLGIDPKTKTAIFSDRLNFETAVDLFRRFHTRINVAFGIGTYLGSDMGIATPGVVIKMVECNGEPVAKISDDPAKGMCMDPVYLRRLSEVVQKKINSKG